MTKEKWHNGPWSLRPHDNYMDEDLDEKPLEIIDDNGEAVACNTPYYPTRLPSQYANLISSAPELYEALKNALHLIAEKEGTSDENDAIYDAAKAALSKARGEQ